MNIILIYPPYDKKEVFTYLSNNAPVLPPLGLAYLAAYLRKHFYNVNIIDSPALNLNINKIIKILVSKKPELIGITTNSPLYSKVLALTKEIKTALPGSKIVLGGYHPTFLPKEVLSNDSVDFIVRGEGEHTLLELCQALEKGESLFLIKNIGFKYKDKLILTEPRDFIKNLDDLPFPAYDLLPIDKYYTGNNFSRKGKCISVIVSRGCRGNCFFCTSPGFWKRIYRKHSPEYVISLLNYLYEKFKINWFQFRDDTFTLDEDWIRSLCNLMKKNKYKYRWDCYSRFDTINEDLLKEMKEAGCYQISLGVESYNEELLKTIKGFSKSQIYNGIKLLKKNKLKIRLFFMLGPPVSDLNNVDKIIYFANKLDPDAIVVTTTIPYPGSYFYSLTKNLGLPPFFDKEIPKIYEGFYNLNDFNKEYIKIKILEVYKKFYLRPTYIIRQIFLIRDIRDFLNLLYGSLSILKILIKIFFKFNRND